MAGTPDNGAKVDSRYRGWAVRPPDDPLERSPLDDPLLDCVAPNVDIVARPPDDPFDR